MAANIRTSEIPIQRIKTKTSDDVTDEPRRSAIVSEASQNDQHVPVEGEPMLPSDRNPEDDDSNGNDNVIDNDVGRGQPGTQRRASSGNIDPQSAPQPCKDKVNWVSVIFFIQGIGTLYPWNSFLTVKRFFTEHKFANVSDDTAYKDKFILFVTYGNFFFYVIFLFVALFITTSHSKWKCLVSLVIQLVLFIITTILASVDSSGWPAAYFGITMVIVVFFSATSALFQSGVYALAARIPGCYSIKSYIAGQSAGGTIVTLATIVSTACAGTLKHLAIMHFFIASLALLLCIITFWLLFRMEVVRSLGDHGSDQGMVINCNRETFQTLGKICKEAWLQIFNIWMTFFVTLQFYPEVLGNIKSSNIPETSPDFREKYFVLLVCFFTFNFCDFVGSVLPGLLKWKWPRLTIIFVIIRLVFIFFIFCNYRPDQRTAPVVLQNDVGYAVLVVIFSLSNGYLKTTIIEDGISAVSDPALKSKAASLMAFFLVLGITFGTIFSSAYPEIVSIGEIVPNATAMANLTLV